VYSPNLLSLIGSSLLDGSRTQRGSHDVRGTVVRTAKGVQTLIDLCDDVIFVLQVWLQRQKKTLRSK
jgi:hypothetical protein